MIAYILLIIVIFIQLIIIGVLLDEWDKMEKNNKKYYDKLRHEYDIKMSEYREDIDIRNEIINSYRNLYKKESA